MGLFFVKEGTIPNLRFPGGPVQALDPGDLDASTASGRGLVMVSLSQASVERVALSGVGSEGRLARDPILIPEGRRPWPSGADESEFRSWDVSAD